MRLVLILPVIVPLAAIVCLAQAPAPYVSVMGTVTNIDAGGHALAVKTTTADTTVKFDDKTSFRVVPPGETDMRKATPAAATDVTVGDRVLARVRTENPTGLPANTVYVMKAAALTQRDQKREEEWKTQSVAGLVKSVDGGAKTITISVRGTNGAPHDVTVDFSATADVRRLSPDTLQYAPAAATGIQAGDQLRVLGDKSADGTQVKANAMLYATLRSIPVTVKSVDTSAGVITATDIGTKKPLAIKVNAATSLKKLDEATATMLARRMNPSLAAAGGRGRGGDGAAAGGGGAPAGGGRGRGGAGDLNSILEKQEALQLADLKAGDPLIITGAASTDGQNLTATAVVAGVDPILRAAPQTGPDPLGGNWNIGEAPTQ